jgi:hypothetical protein
VISGLKASSTNSAASSERYRVKKYSSRRSAASVLRSSGALDGVGVTAMQSPGRGGSARV